MNTKHTRLTRARSFSLAPAAILLAALAGSAAQAQVTPLTAPPAGEFATTSSPFAPGNGFVAGPVTSTLGSGTATFTATATGPRINSFETFVNSAANGTPLAFPVNTVLLDTFDGGDGSSHTPTGPLDISFSSPISAFGLTVESSREDTSIFTFSAYSGAVSTQNLIGTFTYAPVTQTASSPQSLFIGGQATGNQIVNIVVSDTSNASGNTSGTNDFYFGSVSSFSPVPEASTTISFGLLLMLGLGGVLIRRKMSAPKTATN